MSILNLKLISTFIADVSLRTDNSILTPFDAFPLPENTASEYQPYHI